MLRRTFEAARFPPAAWKAGSPWLVLVLVALLPIASAMAREHLVSDAESPGGGEAPATGEPGMDGDGVPDAEERVLAAVNPPVRAPGRLERLTAGVPPGELTTGIERALDPAVLRRFGGPGLDLPALQAAVNEDLRNGGHPHVALALGFVVHAGLSQLERLRLPAVHLGPVGAGFGVATRSRLVSGGFYLAPPGRAGGPLVRGVSLNVRGPVVPVLTRTGARRPELFFAAEQRPHPSLPGDLASLRITLPLTLSSLRVGFAASATQVRSGKTTTHILGMGPTVALRDLTLQGEFRQVEQSGTRIRDLGLRAERPPFAVAVRCRQNPRHEQPAALDIRFQVTNVVPHLGL